MLVLKVGEKLCTRPRIYRSATCLAWHFCCKQNIGKSGVMGIDEQVALRFHRIDPRKMTILIKSQAPKATTQNR